MHKCNVTSCFVALSVTTVQGIYVRTLAHLQLYALHLALYLCASFLGFCKLNPDKRTKSLIHFSSTQLLFAPSISSFFFFLPFNCDFD
ncbi:hypothetical protein V1514DRAFT_42384 [Lipomyces japonicus]|uniref:uncharacterized protein n=1 Tax=Lipomyces japonicus TaxID=56871 RepID=UPI0034CD6770